MTKFFSIGGMSPSGGEGRMGNRRPAGADRSAQIDERVDASWRNFLSKEVVTSTGMQGEKVEWSGRPAEILHEEFNPRSETVEQTVKTGWNTTAKVTWEQGGNRTLRLTDSSQTRD